MANSKLKGRDIRVVSRSPWGDIDEDTAREAAERPDLDRWFLPGYSDKRREAELALAKGQPFTPLKIRCQWVSTVKPDGTDDSRRYHQATIDGYRPMKWDEAKEYGIELEDANGDPQVAARKSNDGNIRCGSQMLMFCDEATAKRNYLRVKRRTEELSAQPQQRVSQAIAETNQNLGYEAVEEFTEAELDDQKA